MRSNRCGLHLPIPARDALHAGYRSRRAIGAVSLAVLAGALPLAIPSRSTAAVLAYTGFDNFTAGERPYGWTFSNSNADTDTYTSSGDFGKCSPALKLDDTGDQVSSPVFSGASQISFWLKGFGVDAASALLIEEYHSSWFQVTNVAPIPTTGTTFQCPLNSSSTRVRFTYSKSAGNAGLDDIAVRSGHYLRVNYLNWTDYGTTGSYGDAALYEFPGPDGILDTGDDRRLLLDGGGQRTAPSALSKFLDAKIGAGGTIQYMLNSSNGSDHVYGLHLAVGRYVVQNYYENVRWPAGDKLFYDSFIADLQVEGVNFYYYNAGHYLSGPSTNLGPGWDPYVEARVLAAYAAPPITGASDNTWSGVIQIRNGASVFLSGGDAEGANQEQWILADSPTNSYSGAAADLAATDVFKSHHHGSHLSNYSNFCNQMSPLYAVHLCAHASNGSGHPRGEALTNIHNAGAIQYRVDLDHHVEVRCDSSDNYEFTRWMAWSAQTDKLYTPSAPNYYAAGTDLHYPPPGSVTGLQVVNETPSYVLLSWNNLGASYSYNVYRSREKNGDSGAGAARNPGVAEATGIYEKLTASAVSYTTYTDASASPGIKYFYRISSLRTYSMADGSDTWYARYERRWSNEVDGIRTAITPTPTPIGFHSPSPTPYLITPTPAPTASATPSPQVTPGPRTIYSWPLDADPGWSKQSDWAFGDPNSGGGSDRGDPDPPNGHTGSYVYGYRLGPASAGDYTNNLTPTQWLTTTAIDCSKITQTHLKFWVWLNVQANWADHAYLQISTDGTSWTTIYENPADNTTDSNWIQDQFNVGQYADQQPSVYFRWGMGTTNYTRRYSGWNIDDIEIYGIWNTTPTPYGFKTPTPAPTATPTPHLIINEHFDYFDTGVRPAGWTFVNCNSDSDTYTSTGSYGLASPSLKLGYNPTVALTKPIVTDVTSTLSFWTKGFSVDLTSNLLIEELTGVTWATVTDIVALPSSGTVMGPFTLDPATTKLRFTYIKSAGNLALDDVYVYGPVTPSPITPTPTLYLATPTPSPTPRPVTPTPRLATPTPYVASTPTPPPIPSPSPTCGPNLAFNRDVIASGDYDGDGAAEIAIFRPSVGLWSVKGVTRRYFGNSSDQAVPGDYDGDGTAEIAIFRPASGLWSILGLTRAYFGVSGDRAVPSDYNGNGSCEIGVFRENGGLWSIRFLTRFYFGATNDWPIPGDYDQDGISEAGLYRVSSGQWMIREFTRSYFGVSSDWPVPGDYLGSGERFIGVFRPCSGMWAMKHLTRIFFGNCFDYPRPADFDGDGTDDVGIFRELSGMWAVRNLTRAYFGTASDLPVTR